MTPIRILIAEDSPVFADVLRAVVEAEFDMTVVGIAANGADAISLCRDLHPDLVLMDIQMPEVDGFQATEAIMAEFPTPILVVTADPFHGGQDLSFRALAAGALDLVGKPEQLPWPEAARRDFLRKIRLLAQVPVVRHMRGRKVQSLPVRARRSTLPGHRVSAAVPAVVGIVASTGGPGAMARLIAGMDATFPAPILVVQHIIPGFATQLANWLGRVGDVSVVEAEEGMVLQAGQVVIAPGDRHLEVRSDQRLHVTDSLPVEGHRPSGDLLLESLARHFGPRSLGVVMSGMGSDGTTGLAAIKRAGGRTYAQDRESCVVYGMPQSAIELGVIEKVVNIDELACVLRDDLQAILQDVP